MCHEQLVMYLNNRNKLKSIPFYYLFKPAGSLGEPRNHLYSSQEVSEMDKKPYSIMQVFYQLKYSPLLLLNQLTSTPVL